LCPSTRSDAHREAGFTLIEVVVALAVIAIALVSIGSLVGASVRGAQALDQHIALDETARGILGELGNRNALEFGTSAGTASGVAWRVDISPFRTPGTVNPLWEPVTETITVSTTGGKSVSIATLHLRRRPAE